MSLIRRTATTRVSDIRLERIAGKSRVCALVDGSRIWFSSESELTASPEAFGSMLLSPLMHRRRALRIEDPVSRIWRENATRLSSILSEWWQYPPISIDAPVRDDHRAKESGVALAFSCGVDSFHSLLSGPRPDVLVAVHGFDVPLDDEVRMLAYAASVQAVASAMGIDWTIVRTNARQHPALGRPWLWERSHGGALASIGHLLSNRVGEFMISSTYSARNAEPWGSTSVTDPLFSSDCVSINHFGTDSHREQKIRVIAGSALAQKHLRVCWANRSRSGNCSRCGKCVVTMLLLEELGALNSFEVFAGAGFLPAALDALPYIETQINITDRLVQRAKLSPEINDAARRLVVRSRKAAKLNGLRQRLQGAVAARV